MTFTYFGYGSLVNIDTIPAGVDVTPGRLANWKREWKVCGTGENGLGRCALTVREAPGSEIRGVVAREPLSGLGALREREKRYDIVEGISAAFQCEALGNPGPEGLFLFRASAPHYMWGTDTHPILQSYLDCVLAGYFRIWGEEGIDHFLETTDGWQVPVLADRSAPHYVRSVILSDELADLIDGKLRQLGVSYLKPAS
ncbi:gamma-glutamylcyclotransferase [Rhodobacterales bacterium]|nr:gamma-glutamylcyclotransferase [Rhodobacterales bacterium]